VLENQGTEKMPAKKTSVVIIVSALMIVILGSLAYLNSDHHKYNLALKHFRIKEYRKTIQALNRLTPKYQRTVKAAYLRGYCLYHFANEAFENQQYDASLQTLATIPEAYVEYKEVEKLRSAIQLKQNEIAEAKRQEQERKQADRERAEELAEANRKRAEEDAKQTAKENELALEQEKKRIIPLYDTGLLTKFNIDANEAWVNPAIWNGLEYDAKVGVAATLAKICDLSDSSGRISIINNKTGKQLARYSQTWGFKHN